jgi:spore germination cell wall hydrolase CwlJ-like protein
MLGFNSKHSSRTVAFAALFFAALTLLALASTAIYTAVANPDFSWNWSQSRDLDQPPSDFQVEPEQFKFREGVAPEAAAAINAAVPDANEPIIPAISFSLATPSVAAQSRMLAIDCLTAAVYYEAASENLTGQRAVAQVVLNRVRHPAFPNSVCGVVFQGSERITGCQFSFTCDGSMARRPSNAGWARAQAVAAMALSGYVEPSVGLATHYHTVWVVPYWSSSLTKLRTLGAHIFYRWAGRNGTPAAFKNRYSGLEQIPLRKQLAVSPVIDELSEELVTPGASAADIPSNKDVAPAKEVRRETGLLNIPQSRIKSDVNKSADEKSPPQNTGLLVDKDSNSLHAKDHALKADRK